MELFDTKQTQELCIGPRGGKKNREKKKEKERRKRRNKVKEVKQGLLKVLPVTQNEFSSLCMSPYLSLELAMEAIVSQLSVVGLYS